MAKKSPQSILKAKGLIPKTWDLRFKLTDYKKRVIRQRIKDYPEVIKYPAKFESRKYSMEKASQLLDSGYSGVGQYILIPYRGGKKEAGQTKVLKDTVKIDRGDRIETVYLNTGKGFLAKVRRMQEREWRMEENGEEHERETYWAFKVGDNNTFLNLRGNLDMLLRYGENLNFTDSQAKNYVHLVKVEYKDGEHAIKQLPYNPNNPADPSNYLGPYKKKRARKWSSKRGK